MNALRANPRSGLPSEFLPYPEASRRYGRNGPLMLERGNDGGLWAAPAPRWSADARADLERHLRRLRAVARVTGGARSGQRSAQITAALARLAPLCVTGAQDLARRRRRARACGVRV